MSIQRKAKWIWYPESRKMLVGKERTNFYFRCDADAQE